MSADRLVLHVINTLGLSGGAEQQLVTNLSHFDDPSLHHHVAFLYGVSDPSWLETMATPVTALNGTREEAALITSGLRLNRLVRKLRPDLIHCSLADSALISRIVGRVTRTPVLESLVNISHEEIRTVDSNAVKSWKLATHRAVDRFTMQGVTAFHALTDEVARSWVETVGVPRERITIIPRGVPFDLLDASRVSPEERIALRRDLIGDGEILILVVGREEPQKGHRYLLDAFVEVLARDVDAHLVMLGRSGSRTSAISDQIDALGIQERVKRLGVTSDVYRYMGLSDILAFPSLYEGMGVSLLEAMGAGLPVIVFDRPPMNQIVRDGETGRVVPERSSMALAEAIAELASDPLQRSDLGGEASRYIRGNYDAQTVSKEMEDLYRSILKHHSGRSTSGEGWA